MHISLAYNTVKIEAVSYDLYFLTALREVKDKEDGGDDNDDEEKQGDVECMDWSTSPCSWTSSGSWTDSRSSGWGACPP